MKAWIGVALAAAAMAGGCGGGGGNPGLCHASAQTCEGVSGGGGGGGSGSTGVTGLWVGATDNARTAYALTLANGQAWVIYSAPGNPNLLAGAIEGTYSASGSTLTAPTALDANFEGLGVRNASVTATVTPQQSIDGSVAYTASTTVGFTATYQSQFTLPASLTAAAGTYTGTAVAAAGQDTATVVIDTSGGITGTTALGCQFTGSAVPETGANVFDLTIRFQGAPCSNGAGTVTGVAYVSSGRLYAAALNATRTDGFLFLGPRL